MYKNKKEVDKHVEKLVSKLPPKDFNARTYSIARLYYEVGDYDSCKKYVEVYLTHKANNAAAHKLLGQTFLKLGLREQALEEFKISLDLDPVQSNVILDICEMLADEEVTIKPGLAKHWCDMAESKFPQHPSTFKLKERLVAIANPNPEALIKLLTSELSARPKDAVLHVRLLNYYLTTNQSFKAFEHSCNVEFGKAHFLNNITWYKTLSEVLKCNTDKINDWLYQLLLLTVKEKLCTLSLTEVPQGSSTSLLESNELLYDYDQAILSVSKAGPMSGYAEFYANLLRHHHGQFVFLAATFVLKKAKRDQLNWYDATKFASLLMLISWQTVPIDPKANWLTGTSEIQRKAVLRWNLEGAYRCSQSGHIILGNNQEKCHLFVDQISQFCSSNSWKDKLYDSIFANTEQRAKADSYLKSNLFQVPSLKLPRKVEVQAYDNDAQKLYPNSLHHFVWILLNYKNFSDFKCTIFDMLTPAVTSCGPETLNKLDVLAFLYSATLTAHKQKDKYNYIPVDLPSLMPANITDLLCPLPQIKWWDCAYKFSQNELGSEYTDIRSTLSRGIEVVRCIDNHGLDPELLCTLGRTFNNLSKLETTIDDKSILQTRANVYYSSAIPILEKLKSKAMIKLPAKRLFDYTHKELDNKELNSLLHECKLSIGLQHFNEGEYVKAIEYFSDLKSPQSYYYLSASYNKIACEEKEVLKHNDRNSKYVALLGKAKHYAYKSFEDLKEIESYKSLPLYSDIQDLIENIEASFSKIDSNISISLYNDVDTKYSSDENGSEVDSVPLRSLSQFNRNLSSTPKQAKKQPLPNMNLTNYRTALDSQVFNNTHIDQQSLNRIEEQIKNLQKRDASIEDFKEQTRNWFDENKKLGNQIINTIHSNIENTTEQFKLLKISVDQVKDQVAECRKECKDVADLKKQIAELKKEVNKLKKSEQTIDESELYNLDEEYRSNENTTFGAQIPFAPPQVIPPFTQRLVPPFPVPSNPYHLYGQNFCNLYNQYSQLTQNPTATGTNTMFDPTRAHVNYPNIYQTPDQMYLDVAHLVPPAMPPAPVVVPTVPNIPVVSMVTTTVAPTISSVGASKTITQTSNTKPLRALPVNVVITSSDPLPTCTTAPAPILSVTIPQKHIKGSPHNYQIPMPSNTEVKSVAPPIFNLQLGNKVPTPIPANVSTNMSAWNKSSLVFNENTNFLNANDTSKTVVDGPFASSSPNTSLNKSRTLSERSNTSIENYDPCPDFKPIIPLPAEVKVTTGEENETVIFNARAKLFRFVDKQWKERGIGEMKLLRHNVTRKVRVLMRREQVHKICANHIIIPEMEILPMKNETKAYFWVANDFAEETVILEKFCIRFKTADIAKEFYDTFEKARLESQSIIEKPAESCEVSEGTLSTPMKNQIIESQPDKTTVGGFTFSSTPSFKVVPEVTKTVIDKVEPPTSKVNVFSGLTFKTSTASPFSNVFNSLPGTNTDTSKDKTDSSKFNTSDLTEEFEPTVEFKPVVPLPALIDQKTGEEGETILFEHRAKLLRFDGQSKEWKERGLGNIKLLVNKENNQKLRLLMRREQIMKVCCNHAITKEITFVKMPNMDKAVTWCAKDFSEGELVSETFCLRFKTVQTCNEFMDSINKAQSKLQDDIKAAKEEKNSAKQNTQSGFGDQFKPKAGSWYCTACYTNNLSSFNKCACCEQPKQEDNSQRANTQTAKSQNPWGDQFKPKPGTWECKQCFIRNQLESGVCSACNNPKDSNTFTSDINVTKTESISKFNFGIPSQVAKPEVTTSMAPVTTEWGAQFKPKEGSWECNQCLVRNDKSKENCSACNSPKVPGSNTSVITSTTSNTSSTKYTFGIPQSASQTVGPAPSILKTTSSQTFKFGIPQNKESNVKMFGENTVNNSIFNIQKVSDDSSTPINFSKKNNEDLKMQKPALLPTPNTSNLTFGSKEGGTFNFAFKPKSPAKGKSPVKSPKSTKGEDSGEDEYVSDDEGANIHFSPVIPMPEKIDVVTGEENEEELYGHRAKLFIFTDSEWKERGLGVVKILKHKDTGKLRVLMRREQVHKICLNHILSPDVLYNPKDEKTWFFAANDYSEGELHLQQFCLRFQNKDIAMQFKNEIDKAIECKYGHQGKDNSCSDEGDDVMFVSELQASPEDKQRAKELMLPENFFTYTKKQPCEGCRGCENESDETSQQKKAVQVPSKKDNTPSKTLSSYLQNNTNSVYGTPTSLDKTTDTSIFATPLGSNFSKDQSIASKLNEKSPVLSFESGGFSPKEPFGTKSSILAAPKPLIISSDQQTSTPKTIFGASDKTSLFGSSEAKNLFGSMNSKNLFTTSETKTSSNAESSIFSNSGVSTNKSIFGYTLQYNKNDISSKPEVKSIFANDNQKPINLFSGSSLGSIFGPTVQKATETKPLSGIFGQTTTFKFGNDLKDSQDSIKPDANEKPITSLFLNPATQNIVSVAPKEKNVEKITNSNEENNSKAKEEALKVPDNFLSFAALSSKTTDFAIQKKPSDFKWEGAGQQLFTSESPKETDRTMENLNKSTGSATADEEYDPHYEPIVPLPEKIIVTTGEEDEEKIFGERCKLYRFDEKSREWKERGVGEMKILYHPKMNTYRLLLRREQVHKAVLNMLVFMDLELLPMKNSDRAWTWAGRNFADSTGEQETLASRFKTVVVANNFRDKVLECVRKLQVAAAEAIRQEKEAKENQAESIAPLRLPKHLEDSARVDRSISSDPDINQPQSSQSDKENGKVSQTIDNGSLKQVHFEEQEQENDEDDEDYERDYDERADDYEGYYNEEEEEESAVYYACDGEVVIKQDGVQSTSEESHAQVLFDNDACSPKILITDNNTGEILADMLIHTDTEFQMSGNSCSWSGIDYTSNTPANKTVTIYFADGDTAMEFYDSCETSKASTYESNDPES